MDLSDFDAPGRAVSSSEADAGTRWRELLQRVGSEIAGPLTRSLEGLQAATSDGRLEGPELGALREDLEAARRAGMIGQQLARVGSGRLRQSHERLSLAQTLEGVLRQRARDTRVRGVQLKPVLQPVEVLVDPSLLVGLLDAMLDWALAHARSAIELVIDTKPWPAHARLACRFARQAPDETADGLPAPDTLSWYLIEQTAWAMQLQLERDDDPARSGLRLEFPRTVGAQPEAASLLEPDAAASSSSFESKPLAGRQVLVIALRREVRNQVRESIRHLGLMVDYVHGVAEAVDFCDEGLPHAVVFESALMGERLRHLRSSLLEKAPDLAFIEIAEEGNSFEASGFGATSTARIGRDAIGASLPSALLSELSKAL